MQDSKPLFIIEYVDKPTGAKGYLVIDTLINDVTGGGIRIEKGLSLDTVIKLARKMTLKFTVVEPQVGGAKCGIDYDPSKPGKQEVLFRFIAYLKPFLENILVTAADMNTKIDEISAGMQKVDIPSSQYALAKAFLDNEASRLQALERLERGIMLKVDGINMNNLITGYSVYIATEETLKWQSKSLKGIRVAVHGFGSVGGSAAYFLNKGGAKIVAIADHKGTVFADEGLDIPFLIAMRKTSGLIDHAQLSKTYRLDNDPNRVLSSDADVLVLAGPSDVIDVTDVNLIQAATIIEGAINPISQQAETLLHQRNVTVIPDFIAGAGAASLYGILILGLSEVKPDSLLLTVGSQIQRAVRNCLNRSASNFISTRQAAEELAYEKLRGVINKGEKAFQLGKSFVYV